MNEEKLIEELKSYLGAIKKALDEQAKKNGTSYSIEDWLYSAIAAYAKLNPDWDSFIEKKPPQNPDDPDDPINEDDDEENNEDDSKNDTFPDLSAAKIDAICKIFGAYCVNKEG